MQRRGESGQQVKGRRHRANRPKARKAPTAHASTDHSPEQFDRLKRERDEALEQLAATSDVLQLIKRNSFEWRVVSTRPHLPRSWRRLLGAAVPLRRPHFF
jgi:hypothetical protein